MTSVSLAPRSQRPWFRFLYAALIPVTLFLFQPTVGRWFFSEGHWWLCILLRAFAVSFLTVPLTIWLAHKHGILDMPEERKLHVKPMPRFGGLAILLGVLVTTVQYTPDSLPLAALLSGGLSLFVLSFIDDARGLSASTRLVVQVGLGLFLHWAGLYLSVFPDWFIFHHELNAVLTIVWLIGILNALNFLDGIDGLAGSLGVLGALLFLAVGWQTRQSHLALLCSALAGSCLGFLPYNWHRASTFLGDSGSTLIGFLLAGVAVWGSWSEGNPVISFSTPLLILAIPIFDMTYTTIARIKKRQVRTVRQWLVFTGKDHLHHRLMQLGMPQPQAAVFILVMSLILGLGGLVIRLTRDPLGAWLLVIQSVLILLCITLLMLLARKKGV